VISIISLLSSIVLTTLNGARAKARDAVRDSDMNQIKLALDMYYNEYGCLPTTRGSSCGPASGTYDQSDIGGWDYSSQPIGVPSFMSFLVTVGYLPKQMFDPINNMTGGDGPYGTYSYKYYCYTSGPYSGPHLGYWKEDGSYRFILGSGWTDLTFTDSNYLCK
jgi:type II secretory pathway pseudopilin PulG